MSSLNQIVYRILESVRGSIGKDENIDVRELKYDVHNTRALFLRNELNKNRTIDPSIIQSLGCIELEVVDKSECCDVFTGCHILRTNQDIPATIERHNAPTITRVGPPDKMQFNYPFVEYERAKVSGNGRFNKNANFSFLLENRIYIVTKKVLAMGGLKHINVMGVFENPDEVKAFKTCSGTSCYTDDDKYPLKTWMIDSIIKDILNKFIKTDAIATTDEALDNKHKVENPNEQK